MSFHRRGASGYRYGLSLKHTTPAPGATAMWDLEETVIGRIQDLMHTDEESPSKQSERLVALYERSTEAQKEAIDEALVCICGYALKSILRDMAEDTEDEE
jgi:hypothetical protein